MRHGNADHALVDQRYTVTDQLAVKAARAAELLDVTTRTIAEYVEAGKLRAVGDGKGRQI